MMHHLNLDNNSNSWRFMWLICSFDLPTKTAQQKKGYQNFRKFLLEYGFTMLQYSVYIYHYETYAKAKASSKKIGRLTPQNGKVCFFFITDKQYTMTATYFGKIKTEDDLPKKPKQLMLF